jgi:anhydro-N-acetylmuramic acid kinase
MSDLDFLRRPHRPLTVLGLMSGTSLDGIDLAVLITDGERILAHGPAATTPYPEAFRERLRRRLGCRPDAATAALAGELTRLHAEAVATFLSQAGLDASTIDLVGFHGHTVWHRPEAGETFQIGDGQWLADQTRIPVVGDFRSADVRAGGQGAPLVPLYHAALAAALPKPLVVVNIGGVANITWIGPEKRPETKDGVPAIIAFDTGPGNALLDDWMQARTGRAFDDGGRLAAGGTVDRRRVAGWLGHEYFRRPPPKSLDRDAFAGVLGDCDGMTAADGAASLTAFTAGAIASACRFLPEPPGLWLVTGGGRLNLTLRAMLGDATAAPVRTVDAVGWRGDWLEAEAFAYLAVRAVRDLPLSLPLTTGVPAPQPGGVLYLPR